MKDFRTVSFESLFNADLDYESLEIIKNKLAENQLLRCNQLIQIYRALRYIFQLYQFEHMTSYYYMFQLS